MKKLSEDLQAAFDTTVKYYEDGGQLSFTALKAFNDSPFSFIMRKVKETTKSMALGSLEHMAVLEPEKFREIPILQKADDGTWGSAANRKAKKEFIEKFGDNYMLPADAKLALMYRMAIELNPIALDLVSGMTKTEIGLEFEFLGSNFRGYVDFQTKRDNILQNVDLKKMSFSYGVSEYAILKRVKDQKLHWQQALYNHGSFNDILRTANLIVIDNNYNINVVEITADKLHEAHHELEDLMTDFYACLASGNWYKTGSKYVF